MPLTAATRATWHTVKKPHNLGPTLLERHLSACTTVLLLLLASKASYKSHQPIFLYKFKFFSLFPICFLPENAVPVPSVWCLIIVQKYRLVRHKLTYSDHQKKTQTRQRTVPSCFVVEVRYLIEKSDVTLMWCGRCERVLFFDEVT